MKTLTALAAALVFAAPLAHAVPITVDATGTVTDVFAADAFGTDVGDVFTLHAVFDSSAVADAGDVFGLGAIPGLQLATLAMPGASLSIDLEARHWTEHSEPLFGQQFPDFPNPAPWVVLLDGKFLGLEYFGIGPGDDVFLGVALEQMYFGFPAVLGGDSNQNHPPVWLGAWDLEHATVTVPEPGTLGLLLLGVVGIARRLRAIDGAVRARR
jgi:hypothetical protein